MFANYTSLCLNDLLGVFAFLDQLCVNSASRVTSQPGVPSTGQTSGDVGLSELKPGQRAATSLQKRFGNRAINTRCLPFPPQQAFLSLGSVTT